MPFDKIQQYFSNDDDIYDEPSEDRMRLLLNELGLQSIHVREIYSYLTVFCILLSFNEGSRLKDFIGLAALSDASLPFDNSRLTDLLMDRPLVPSTSWKPWDEDFVEQFEYRQWEFCIPLFERSKLHEMQFGDKQILPIVRKEKAGHAKTGSSLVIWIHPSYNKLTREQRQVSRFV